MPSPLTSDEDLIRELPLPLAQLCRRAHNARDPLERHQATFYCWEAGLKLLASAAILEYAARGGGDPAMTARLGNLARPSLGHWWEFVYQLVPRLAEPGGGPFADVKEGLLGRTHDLPNAAALLAALRAALKQEGRKEKKWTIRELFDSLITYRNVEVGHGSLGMRAEDFYGRMADALLAALPELFRRLDVLAGGRLVYVSDVSRDAGGGWVVEQLELVGENGRRAAPLRLRHGGEDLPVPKRLYLRRPATAAGEMPAPGALHPLVIYHEATRTVCFLNAQRGGDAVEYLDYVDGEHLTREDLAEDHRALMEKVTGAPVDTERLRTLTAGARGEEAVPPAQPAPTAPVALAEPALRVALLYKRNAQPDEQVLRWLEQELAGRGHQVFVDRHMTIGVEWAKEVERQLSEADAAVVLLSAASVQSEVLPAEVRTAQEAARKRGGKPRLLPVRLDFEGDLSAELAGALGRLQYFLWKGPRDNPRLVGELLGALRAPPTTPLKGSPPAGVLPLDSEVYVERPTDGEFLAAIRRQDSIIRIRGARQVGKTSLLARGLHEARTAGTRVVMTDFQKLNASDLESVETFFRALGEWVADQLGIDVLPGQVWNPQRGPSRNFEQYVCREVMGRVPGPLLWAMDEVDRLFSCPYRGEVFGLLRSWHNARATEPTLPWCRLTLAIAYATEAHLFIDDMNQSPFNVGTALTLDDFDPEQLGDLNRRYGSPLRTEADLKRYHDLVGGHPYLANRGLYEIVQRGLDLAAFEAQAQRDDGIFGDHLRRILVLLARNAELCEVVRGVLRGKPCPSAETFYRLRSAGVLSGDSARAARPRCRLYRLFLERNLP